MNIKSSVAARYLLLLLCMKQTATAQVRTLNGNMLSREAIDAFVLRQMDSLKIPAISIAIIQNGSVVYHKVAGIINEQGAMADTNTLFEAASMTKPVFAYAVHKLVQRGVMNLDTPLYRYYPNDDVEGDERYKRITARMVLSHTTGFPNWRGGGGSELTINFEPGTRFSYSGEGFKYLQQVVVHLLHEKVQDILAKEVFQPLGMEHSFLVRGEYTLGHLADGYKDNKEWGRNLWQQPNVAFSMCTEARDYAKFVMHLMKESHLPGSITAQMLVPQMEAEAGDHVCLGIFMEQTQSGVRYYHSGNNNNRYTSCFAFYKDKDMGYVFFVNNHQEQELTKKLNELLEQAK